MDYSSDNMYNGAIEGPISDNSVSTTYNGRGGQPGWAPPSQTYRTHSLNNQPNEYPAQPQFYELDAGDNGMVLMATHADPTAHFRTKNGFKNNMKAIKTGLKSAANWIPNIFNRSGRRDSDYPLEMDKMDKKAKSKLSRDDSLNSNSFFSSGLGSDASQFVSNSTSSNKGYGQYQQNAAVDVKPPSSSLNPVTSYDSISVGASSVASCNSSVTTHTRSQREAKHLSQTNNLVIQPQFAHPQTMTPNLSELDCGSVCKVETTKVEINKNAQTPDSMSNLILPDDMVSLQILLSFLY